MIKVLDGKYKNNYSSSDIAEYKTLIFDAHKKTIGDIQNFFSLLKVDYEDFGYIYNMDIIIDFETDNSTNMIAFYIPNENYKKGYIHLMPEYLSNLIKYTKKLNYSSVVDNLNSTLIHESLHYNRDVILSKLEDRPEIPLGFEEVINETLTQMVLFHKNTQNIDIEGFYNYILKNSKDKKELCVIAYLIKKYGLDFVNWYILPSKDNVYKDKPKEYFGENYDTLLYYINQLFINTYYGLEGNEEIYKDTMNVLEHKLKN